MLVVLLVVVLRILLLVILTWLTMAPGHGLLHVWRGVEWGVELWCRGGRLLVDPLLSQLMLQLQQWISSPRVGSPALL